MMRRSALAVAALLLLAACGDEYTGPEVGTVVGHEYDDEDLIYGTPPPSAETGH